MSRLVTVRRRATGKAFCLISAPSKAAAMRIHERTGHPTNDLYERTISVQALTAGWPTHGPPAVGVRVERAPEAAFWRATIER